MRISDWSSDVCSSDLDRSFLVRIGGGVVGDVHHAAVVEDRRVEARSLLCLVVEPQEGGDLLPDRRHRASPCALNVLQRAGSDRREPTVDRKSVGEGRSWSVRLESGGGRRGKKNKQLI